MQFTVDPFRLNAGNTGTGMGTVCFNTGLSAGQADGIMPHVLKRHGQHGGGHNLTGGHQQVKFAGVWRVGERARQFNKVIGRIPHGRNHRNHLVSPFRGINNATGHGADTLSVANRCTAIFLHDNCHVTSPEYLDRADYAHALPVESAQGNCHFV